MAQALDVGCCRVATALSEEMRRRSFVRRGDGHVLDVLS